MIHQGKWIWLANRQADKNFYASFRKTFQMDQVPDKAVLSLAADSNFSIWINGIRIPGSQFSDYAQSKTYSSLPVTHALRSGRNTIAILVHFIGEEFATYTAGRPGLIAALYAGDSLLCATDDSWKARQDTAFASGPVSKVSIQLGYTFLYDARREEPWQTPDYRDDHWPDAVLCPAGYWQSLRQRPVEQLTELPPPGVRAAQAGYLLRTQEYSTPAESCFHDLMRPVFWQDLTTAAGDPNSFDLFSETLQDNRHFTAHATLPENAPENGYYLITDLGKEQVGFLKISLDAAEGTVVDIAHGEHLLDGRVRCSIGGRNFADRYICKEGINDFLYPLRRIGARFVELHVTQAARPPRWGYAGIIPVEYPLPELPPFRSSDRLHDKLHDVAVDTLKACMHEHYEDCPWREQALYAYDSRNQILYGYYLWGNDKFAAASLDLLGKGLREDGQIAITAPRAPELSIPVFTFVWIAELWEHYWHSGDLSLFTAHRGTVQTILEKALARQAAHGLYAAPSGSNVWNFCEWVDSLDRCDAALQAPYNLYLYEALTAAANLSEAAGIRNDWRQRAAALGCAIEEFFWDGAKGCYATLWENGTLQKYHEHIQTLMLFHELVPAEKQQTVLQNLWSGKLTGLSFSALPYLPGAVMARNEDCRRQCSEKISSLFEPLILQNATSLWETPGGGNAFRYAGSLCHAWSSLPAYFNMRYILGITPQAPGFRKVEIKPWCGRLYHAEGQVQTPHGRITVRWDRKDDGIAVEVRAPEEVEIVFAAHPEFPVRKAFCNGQEV